MTLHHFRKEFQYLRLRWLAFLGLLGFDLAVNLEWLLPMRAGMEAPGWLGYLPVVILLAGLSLLLSCPEDRPGSDRSFISTRPLPWAAYWQARVLLWLALIVVPVVLQNGLYLMLSGRPMADVLRGMGERASFGAGFSAWLLPALVLWQRREMWKALFAIALVLVVTSKLLDVIGGLWWYFYGSDAQTWAGLAAGWLVFGLLSGWVAWRHLQHGHAFRRRLCLTCAAAVAGLLTARFWVLTQPEPVAQNQGLVQALAPGLKVEMDLATMRFDGFERPDGIHGMTVVPETRTGKPGVHVDMRFQGNSVEQGGRLTAATPPALLRVRQKSGFDSPQEQVYCGDTNLRDFFPAGTLFYTSQTYSRWSREGRSTLLARFAQPHPAEDRPLRLAADYSMEWYERDLALDLPVVAGSRGECDEARWEILSVTPAAGPQPGALSIALRVETRDHWNAENGRAIVLHSPQRQLVWLDPVRQSVLGARASHTGWQRSQIELTWKGIFNYADGEATGEDAAKLRLVLLRSRFLGASSFTWKSPDMKLTEFPSSYGDRYHWDENKVLYAGREVKAFQERMAAAKPLTDASSEKDARRYLYDLFSTAAVTEAVYAKAAYPAITQAFEPLGKHHLSLLLDLPSGLWPGWSDDPPKSLLDQYLNEDQREAVIDRVMAQPVLVDVVIRKGWAAAAAERLKPRLLGMPSLRQGYENLLFAWGDDESHARLLQAAKHDLNAGMLRELDKIPTMRLAAEQIALSEYRKRLPLSNANHYETAIWFKQGANFGSAEAFDLCLRWLALGGDVPGAAYPALLTAEGGDFWRQKKPDHERWPLFRRLKVSDFEYVAEKRAWKFRLP